MPSQLAEVALEHAAVRRALAVSVAGEAARMWAQVDAAAIAVSWTSLLPRLFTLVTGAQRAAAGRADLYVDDALDAQGLDPGREGRVLAAGLSGVASDGRGLAGLLYQPAVTALVGIRDGASTAQALNSGRFALDMIVRTQVADAGRAADQVAMTARPQVTTYVRMLVGGSCARCAILAGRRYPRDASFNRHPRCDCIGVPSREDTADDVRTDPKRYFASLSRAEQDRLFTKAGAEAIREGADIAQVVNARRGLYTAAGGVKATRVGARKRRVRLLPEECLRQAGGDRAKALRLLRTHGYLI